jgi:Putative transposase
LNLNVHFHLLFLDGVYRVEGLAAPVFRPVCEPGAQELQGLIEQIAVRIGRTLEQRGLIERDVEKAWLASEDEAGPLDDLIGHSITYRIAVGPRAGQKLFTLQPSGCRAGHGRRAVWRVARTAGEAFRDWLGSAAGARRRGTCPDGRVQGPRSAAAGRPRGPRCKPARAGQAVESTIREAFNFRLC